MAAYDTYAYGRPRANHERNMEYKYYDDHVPQVVIVDEITGRSRSPYHDTGNTYVIESETTEHVYAPRLHANDKYGRSSSPPPEVDDFFNKVQIEASRPHNNKKYGSSPPGTGYGGGYGRYDYKPTANYPARNHDNRDDYYRKKDSPTRSWDRPINHAARPNRDANKLGLPTNNIEEALNYLKGTATKFSPAVHTSPTSSQPRPSRYVPEEAARQYEYDNYRHEPSSSPPWPRTTAIPQTTGPTAGRASTAGVIDSNEAARRFHGKIVRIWSRWF